MEVLRAKHKELCELLGVSRSLRTQPTHSGEPHVEKVGEEYHYVVTERGSEFERQTTYSLDEVLYWLMSDVVSDLASGYELKHRVKGQSFRRQLFAKELELMGLLNATWQARKQGEIDRILEHSPYNDVVEG